MERASRKKKKNGSHANETNGSHTNDENSVHGSHASGSHTNGSHLNGSHGKGSVKLNGEEKTTCEDKDLFEQLFRFRLSDLSSWDSFVHLLSQPTDPSSLAVLRVCYGSLMMLDTLNERGLASADIRWGDEEQCRFPLFDIMRVLPLEWMVMLYFSMIIGAAGITLGVFYRVSCVMFLVPYWYILLLDKSSWNNHSYLFGILGFLLFMSDAHHFWSLDGLFKRQIHNTDVPLWNYTLLRTQIFLVYFLAGLKKLDIDWVSGYSMSSLGEHWVFNPFKLFMTEAQVDYFVVHLGGLTIDLFVGFLLFFDKTRPVGVLICCSFHIMNSQLFSIGMFPYAMVATVPLFFCANWPREIFNDIPRSLRILTPDDSDDTQPSDHCLYSKEFVKSEEATHDSSSDNIHKQKTPQSRASLRHHAAAVFCILFIACQVFLPHSHFITKGYNSWTQGLYGYSWDMMVHSRKIQHVRITFVDKDTGQRGYLNPDMWTSNWRWGSHPDMMKQYAHCIANNLHMHNLHNIELYFDVWISLNGRFQQRTVDPRVDMIRAEWSNFKPTPWMMPLLVDLSDWRTKLAEIEEALYNGTDYNVTDYSGTVNNETHLQDVVFVADFPGLHLENFVHSDIGNATITVMRGEVVLEIIPEEHSADARSNYTLTEGQNMQIPAGQFHNVYTVSDGPSCYMYVYVNTTEATFFERLKELELSLNGSTENKIPDKFLNDPRLDHYMELLKAKAGDKKQNLSHWELKFQEWKAKYNVFVRGYRLIGGALQSIFTGESYHDFLTELNKVHAEVKPES